MVHFKNQRRSLHTKLKVLTSSSVHTLPIYSLKDGHCSATQVDNGSISSGPDLGCPNPELPCSQKSNPTDDTLPMASGQPGWWGEVEPLAKDGYVTVPWSKAHRGHAEPSSPQGYSGTLAVAATRSLRSERGLFSTWQNRSVLSQRPSRPSDACSSQPHQDNCIINCVQVIHPEEVVTGSGGPGFHSPGKAPHSLYADPILNVPSPASVLGDLGILMRHQGDNPAGT